MTGQVGDIKKQLLELFWFDGDSPGNAWKLGAANLVLAVIQGSGSSFPDRISRQDFIQLMEYDYVVSMSRDPEATLLQDFVQKLPGQVQSEFQKEYYNHLRVYVIAFTSQIINIWPTNNKSPNG